MKHLRRVVILALFLGLLVIHTVSIDGFYILTLISQLKSEQVVIGPLTAMKMKNLAGKEAQKFLHFYLRLVIDPSQVGIVYVCLSLHRDSFERNRNMKINVKKFLDESYGTYPHKGYRMTKKMDLGWKKSGSITNLGQKRRFL